MQYLLLKRPKRNVPSPNVGNISWRQRNITKHCNLRFAAKLWDFVIDHYYFINLGIGHTINLFTHYLVLYCCDKKCQAFGTWGLPLISHGRTAFQELTTVRHCPIKTDYHFFYSHFKISFWIRSLYKQKQLKGKKWHVIISCVFTQMFYFSERFKNRQRGTTLKANIWQSGGRKSQNINLLSLLNNDYLSTNLHEVASKTSFLKTPPSTQLVPFLRDRSKIYLFYAEKVNFDWFSCKKETYDRMGSFRVGGGVLGQEGAPPPVTV